MTERIKDSARHYKECESIMKSELVKRVRHKLQVLLERYRDNCMGVEGPELYRNQGKWKALEKNIIPLFEEVREELKKEAGST